MDWEIKKDQEETDRQKQKLIEEIKSLDKSKIFATKPKKKTSLFKKIIIVLGYGKKG